MRWAVRLQRGAGGWTRLLFITSTKDLMWLPSTAGPAASRQRLCLESAPPPLTQRILKGA